MKLKINTNLNKISASFLLTFLFGASEVFCFDTMTFTYDSDHCSNFSNKYTIPNNKFSNVDAVLNIGAKLTNQAVAETKDAAKKFLKKSTISGTRYSKLVAGWGAYTAGSLLKGLGCVADISSSTLSYSSKLLQIVGGLDEIGQNIAKSGCSLTNYGVDLLTINHNSQKTKPSTYLSNLLYGAKEMTGITTALFGGVAQGGSVCARIIGMTSKTTANISAEYIAPTLTFVGSNLTFAGNSCNDYSKTIFSSI